MSNVETSKLYEAIIEEVINDSREDFENNGVDEFTLQELKKIWQEKLSQAAVAKFSWDDQVEQDQQHGQAESQISITGSSMATSNTNGALHGGDSQTGGIQDELLINNEGFGGLNDNQLSYNTTLNQQTSQVPVHDQNQPGQQSQTSGENDIGLQIPQISEDPDIKDEYEDDGGLMLPTVTQTDGNFELTVYTDNPQNFIRKLKQLKQHTKKTQVDGEFDDDDDDDEDDENLFNDSDDINLDLDDDLESDKSDDEDNEQDGHIMLCLYDKVQRIKNKWKCSLKEGIASINGKDYTFQKATGESEW